MASSFATARSLVTSVSPRPLSGPPLGSRKMAKVTERYDVTWEGNFGRGGCKKTQCPGKWFRSPQFPGRDSCSAVPSAGQRSLNGPNRVEPEAGSFVGPRSACHILSRRQAGHEAETVTLHVVSGRRGGGGIDVFKLESQEINRSREACANYLEGL